MNFNGFLQPVINVLNQILAAIKALVAPNLQPILTELTTINTTVEASQVAAGQALTALLTAQEATNAKLDQLITLFTPPPVVDVAGFDVTNSNPKG